MNQQQLEIYQRIQAFPLDEPDSNLPFSKKLARENGWSAEYTQRVIEEYKNFTFLAVVAGHPVSPSDRVDQVWHLHLTYTHSYWDKFCPNILQMPFHHIPSRGGNSEHDKLNDWYSKTLVSYQIFLGKAPPADIWTPLDIRCNRPETFIRVNTQENWILPQPSVNLSKLRLVRWLRPTQASQIATLLFFLTLTVTGCQSTLTTIPNPLDFTGPEFISFYLLVASAVIMLAFWLRWYLRKPESKQPDGANSLDAYEIAYLAGENERAVDAAIANLVQKGHLKLLNNNLELGTPLPSHSHQLEQEIVQSISINGKPDRIRQAVKSTTKLIAKRLEEGGFLVTYSQAQIAQRLPALSVGMVLLLGIAKIFVGISRGKPVGFLIFLCVITALFAFGFLIKPYRSRYGDSTLAKLENKYQNLKTPSASENYELALAFGLFGSIVLADSALADLKNLLVPPTTTSSGGGGDSGGSSCGGGGGCGGGCGGCGGD
ncbi:TIGR04222 domain-containing membrane protein [Limnofasciculus baicalensis]|uniref:TIGR04222 domain-containing membrane protein n=1 Tax=Limnofasciculus baicalensis BBK-W-15 TaxID=2699891 RepID=A0AAE3GRC5_9CYAN|nr:TIGR04222 domain-containing membrane protein [Limnofasciculus baicalensis]MCP2728526.1 TIGR04222 domain-containing membrane protein [Limnofasciculus baicalensis BBK-W-15]